MPPARLLRLQQLCNNCALDAFGNLRSLETAHYLLALHRKHNPRPIARAVGAMMRQGLTYRVTTLGSAEVVANWLLFNTDGGYYDLTKVNGFENALLKINKGRHIGECFVVNFDSIFVYKRQLASEYRLLTG